MYLVLCYHSLLHVCRQPGRLLHRLKLCGYHGNVLCGYHAVTMWLVDVLSLVYIGEEGGTVGECTLKEEYRLQITLLSKMGYHWLPCL